MIGPPLLGASAVPRLETPRLILRGWQAEDFPPYCAMLADAETARFITRRGRPCDPREVWAEIAFHIGHWQLRGYGMFVVEERASGAFLGRVGPLQPEGWPGFEIAWGLTSGVRGKGYAVEAARAAIRWSFDALGVEAVISLIDPRNAASQRVAERVGERLTGRQFAPFADPCDIWELRREDWQGA